MEYTSVIRFFDQEIEVCKRAIEREQSRNNNPHVLFTLGGQLDQAKEMKERFIDRFGSE